MSDDRILERVQAIVTNIAGAQRTPSDAGPDTALGDGGFWLDSVEVLEAILACEHEFGISFDVAMRPEALASVRSLAAAIQAKMTT